jgi:hypothetical protein
MLKLLPTMVQDEWLPLNNLAFLVFFGIPFEQILGNGDLHKPKYRQV